MKARFCSECGKERVEDAAFCGHCGNKFEEETTVGGETSATKEVPATHFSDQVKGIFFQATEKVNSMVGEKGNIDLKLSDVFSAVLKKHTKEEGEVLFITGTSLTTPDESEISASWPKPWLFSRVFLILAATYLLLYICTFTFQNSNAVPGLMMIGAFAVPFSLLIFFWETNAPRNISIFEVVKMFFVGGVASLVATLFIFSFFPVYQLDYAGAITVGVIEEVGKLVIVAYFIKQLNVKFILNGLLIGAAIGAGFAAFETAGYAFNYGWIYSDQAMQAIIVDRAWLSVGGHVVWAAISGAALVYVKGDQPLTKNHFTDPRFIRLFLVPIILHAIWNSPLYFLHGFYFLYIVLIVVAWIFIFTFINAGLKQISRLGAYHSPKSVE
ncbi:PrsW family glutamic-type intramembrane protease [Salipaludibacillus sp. HK11]|uniref:PrsW family glutamic-type intramembrane protease n=1 Tax=Salipaludibacillus sp. HK11 TaxID=3394320 RepID=UPI0039FD8BB4